MFLSRVSIQRPVLATMMNLVLVLFGIIGLSRLPVRELPDIDPPIVSVTTVYPGANAQVTMIDQGKARDINSVMADNPVIAFVFGQKGLMGDLSVQGAKITKLER